MTDDYPDTVPCFRCGKPLRDWSHGNKQPFAAVKFAACSHYPSALWDPDDGSEFVVNLCDDCLCAGAANGRVLRRTYPEGRPRGARPSYAPWRPKR